MIFWRVLFLTLSIICFASFGWAIKKHFRPPADQKISGGMRVVTLIGLISFAGQMIAILLTDRFNMLSSVVGGVFYLTSLFLFYWAIRATLKNRLTLAFSTDEPQFLLKTGPYGFIRHPFYAAYSLFWLAGLLVTLNCYLILPLVVMFGLYYRAAKMEEMKFFGSSNFQAEYVDYRKKAGMFLPKIF